MVVFVKVKVKSCPTLCDPVDSSPPGSSIHGISQARILEWVAASFSRGPSWPRDWTCTSCVFCTDRWTLYHCNLWEARFQNTQAGCHFLFQGIFPTQESNPGLPHCRRILYQLSHKGSPLLNWEENIFLYLLSKEVKINFSSNISQRLQGMT